MATLAWNIKLLGNLTERDFNTWRTSAKIPTIYNFDVTTQDMKTDSSYWDTNQEDSPVPIPEESNTIIITGREGNVDFTPYCYSGNRCLMMAQPDDFTTGTEIFALMLTCDGLLDRDILNKVMDNVDLGTWIQKYQPDAVSAYNNRSTLVGVDGYIDDGNPEGEKLKNAICQYVVKVLGLGTAPVTTSGTQTTTAATVVTSTTISGQIPAMMYILAGGAVVATVLGYYIYKETRPVTPS
jgi:hypothetical protein